MAGPTTGQRADGSPPARSHTGSWQLYLDDHTHATTGTTTAETETVPVIKEKLVVERDPVGGVRVRTGSSGQGP